MHTRLILVSIVILTWPHAFLQPCAAQEPQSLCAISGHVVSEEGAQYGWVVFDADTGNIIDVCHRQQDVPAGAKTIRHPGYIFPGLIDTHNHPHWNTIPMWRPGRTYENRYEWRESQEYLDEVKSLYESIEDAGLWPESVKYAEIRAMIGGTTMIQGTDGADWGYLVRNLDYYGWLAASYVEDITQIEPDVLDDILWAFDEGYIYRLFLHVAEGKHTDPRTQAEFPFLVDAGLARPGVVIIHGIALTQADFEVMAQNDMYLVWSPKTNDVLYGETADVVGALEAGVTVALGPDWSITGSDNLLEELKVAYWYSLTHLGGAITPKQLFKMATCDAAIVAGADDPSWFRLGKIEPGYQADLLLAPRLHPDPHVSLLLTFPRQIRLVVIDGRPVCGDRGLMRRLVDAEELDDIAIRRWRTTVDLIEPEIGPLGEQHYDEMKGLFDALPWDIAPLIEDEPHR